MTINTTGNGFDPDKVKNFVTRIENLHADIASIMGKAMQECKTVQEDIKSVYAEAKDDGIPKKALKSVIKVRDLERKADKLRDDLDEDAQNEHDLLRHALGDLADLPLGESVLKLKQRERNAVAEMGDAPGTYEQN
jgi:uncharacterized protein (UPF0335 family)